MKRAVCIALACVMLLLSLSFFSCSGNVESEETFFMMNTPITIRLYVGEDEAREHFDRCREIISEIESKLSKTIADSDISKINASGSTFEGADGVTLELLKMSKEVYQNTGGAFDPSVAALVELWNTSGERNSLPTESELGAALEFVGFDKISIDDGTVNKTDPDVKIDLGGIGKGYAIGKVLEYLKSTDITGGLVSFGSNVAVFGEKPDRTDFRISLRSPFDTAKTVGTFTMSDKILSVSGDYERYIEIGGEKYHHILDPKSGYPTDNGLHTVAVLCDDGALADALSTALFVMGLDDALEFYESGVYDFEAVFVTDEGVYETDGLRDSFSENNK